MTSHTAPPLTDALTVLFSAAAAGYTGFGVGILGLYGCFASVVNATWHRTVIPLGNRE